jgi:hypothetical protein
MFHRTTPCIKPPRFWASPQSCAPLLAADWRRNRSTNTRVVVFGRVTTHAVFFDWTSPHRDLPAPTYAIYLQDKTPG